MCTQDKPEMQMKCVNLKVCFEKALATCELTFHASPHASQERPALLSATRSYSQANDLLALFLTSCFLLLMFLRNFLHFLIFVRLHLRSTLTHAASSLERLSTTSNGSIQHLSSESRAQQKNSNAAATRQQRHSNATAMKTVLLNMSAASCDRLSLPYPTLNGWKPTLSLPWKATSLLWKHSFQVWPLELGTKRLGSPPEALLELSIAIPLNHRRVSTMIHLQSDCEANSYALRPQPMVHKPDTDQTWKQSCLQIYHSESASSSTSLSRT